ncbi:hypothetical protein D1841_13095 [Neglecta sp. X4]|nr:hypothetical protein [Neglectibacter sp. 59]NBJ74186.1 hypothetical protein [Neglectibacter sp. X4]NCE81997.1 hypothetical protein [Neglectibacter sp. X58]
MRLRPAPQPANQRPKGPLPRLEARAGACPRFAGQGSRDFPETKKRAAKPAFRQEGLEQRLLILAFASCF